MEVMVEEVMVEEVAEEKVVGEVGKLSVETLSTDLGIYHLFHHIHKRALMI